MIRFSKTGRVSSYADNQSPPLPLIKHGKELLPARDMVGADKPCPFLPCVVKEQAVLLVAPDGYLNSCVILVEITLCVGRSVCARVRYPLLNSPFGTYGEHAVDISEQRDEIARACSENRRSGARYMLC